MDLAQFLSTLGAGVAQALPPEVASGNPYALAISRLMRHAGQWQHVANAGFICHIVQFAGAVQHRCKGKAIGQCIACKHPTCFEHAMISPATGEMCCLFCVSKLGVVQQPPPPAANGHNGHAQPGVDVKALRKKHLATLGLADPTDWDEIEATYKDLAKKHHPDRARPHLRDKATARMAAINAAHTWLKENR